MQRRDGVRERGAVSGRPDASRVGETNATGTESQEPAPSVSNLPGVTREFSPDDIQMYRMLRQQKARSWDEPIYQEFQESCLATDGEEDQDGEEDAELSGEVPIEPFNMKREMKHGYIDPEGFYVENRRPPLRHSNSNGSDEEEDDVRDPWLDSLYPGNPRSPAGLRTADRGLERGQKALLEDTESVPSSSDSEKSPLLLVSELIGILSNNETASNCLIRLKNKYIPSEGPAGDKQKKGKSWARRCQMSEEDELQFNRVTEICQLLMFQLDDVFNMKREQLVEFLGAKSSGENLSRNQEGQRNIFYQYRWLNSKDKSVYGPFQRLQIIQWVQSGFFSESSPIELREVTQQNEPVDGVWRLYTLVDGLEGNKKKRKGHHSPRWERQKKKKLQDTWSARKGTPVEEGAQGEGDSDSEENDFANL